jgi:hypothetical protein
VRFIEAREPDLMELIDVASEALVAVLLVCLFWLTWRLTDLRERR